MTTTAYTALEQLLVFQALRTEGPVNSHSVFTRISDQLNSLPLIKDDRSYDSGRLSPDALRELYLWLLKEEVKADLDRRWEGEDGRPTNGETGPGRRKRKLPSPKLATVHEAGQHAHLIPQLVTRLYARYRDLAVRDIRECERRYDTATREIGEIEAGKWDHRFSRQPTPTATQSPRPSGDIHAQTRESQAQTTKSGPASPAVQQESAVPPPARRSSGLDALLNHDPSETSNGTALHRRNSSTTTLPPLSEMAPQSPRFGIPPKVPSHSTHHMQHGHPYAQSPTHAHQSPYPLQNGMHSPQVQQPLSRPSSSSSAKHVLPPPTGMTLPAPTPPHYNSPTLRGPHQPQPLQQRYQQQHRMSMGYSPTNERVPIGYPPPPQQPPPNYYPQQQPYDRRASYPVQQHPQQPYSYPAQQPQASGYQLQPFTVGPQDPTRGQAAQPLAQQQQQQQSWMAPQTPVPAQRPPGPYAQYPTGPSTLPRLPSQGASIVSDILNRLGTPPPKSKQRPLFRDVKRLSQLGPDREIPSPVQDIEPLSPVRIRSELAAPSVRSTRNAGPVGVEPMLRPKKGRGRPKRDRSPHSVVSSAADESARMTRSHSVSTAAGAVPASDDRPGSRGNVKLEPSTPAAFVDEHEAPVEPQSGTSGRMTRKRRGTLQSQLQPPSKRRRQRSVSAVTDDRQATSPGPPPPQSRAVAATRNFHKTSQTIANDINSHKHASYFAHAVRDKDAPGYSSIMKVPQNLKSIRAAITAGSKAVATAATSTSPAGAGADGTVELERSVDLMPPRAIVNAAQLEREVMRMFANAVMFNPGEDGLVRDTREMAEDVEGQMRLWRGFGTEREKEDVGEEAEEEEEEVEEGAVEAGEEETARSVKRRKL